MMTDFVSWARLSKSDNPRIWFSSLFCDGRPVYMAESGIYCGEHTNWRNEAGVLINDGKHNYKWKEVWLAYVCEIITGRETAQDMVHAFQAAFAAWYFNTVKI